MMKTKNLSLPIAVALLLCSIWAYAQESPPAVQHRLLIEGSTTVGPIADEFARALMAEMPNLSITVKKTGSGDGAAAIIDGRAGIATMSRFMKPSEFKSAIDRGVMPVAHVVALDGVAIAVHPSNPVRALTSEQIRQIYLGTISNWSQVGGPNLAITAISRDTNSGTYETFDNIVMQGARMAAGVEYVNSNPQMKTSVATTRGAIGYVGLGFVDDSVKVVPVDGIRPSFRTVQTGRYPISRPLYLFTNGYPQLGSPTFRYVTYHLTEKGQNLIVEKGFVPLTSY